MKSIGLDLKKTIVIDDSPTSYRENKANAIPIKEWNYTQKKDKQLLKILDAINQVKAYEDVRKGIAHLNKQAFNY